MKVFGGTNRLARAVEKSAGTVCAWKRPHAAGGCDGNVPTPKLMKTIFLKAQQLGLDLTAHDLIFGRDVVIDEPVTAALS